MLTNYWHSNKDGRSKGLKIHSIWWHRQVCLCKFYASRNTLVCVTNEQVDHVSSDMQHILAEKELAYIARPSRKLENN